MDLTDALALAGLVCYCTMMFDTPGRTAEAIAISQDIVARTENNPPLLAQVYQYLVDYDLIPCFELMVKKASTL